MFRTRASSEIEVLNESIDDKFNVGQRWVEHAHSNQCVCGHKRRTPSTVEVKRESVIFYILPVCDTESRGVRVVEEHVRRQCQVRIVCSAEAIAEQALRQANARMTFHWIIAS